MTVIPDPDFTIESVRRISFEMWPKSFINPDELAAAGFYYCPRNFDVCDCHATKQDDRVRCIGCGIELVHWEEGDNPMTEHKKWSPSCNFVKQRDNLE